MLISFISFHILIKHYCKDKPFARLANRTHFISGHLLIFKEGFDSCNSGSASSYWFDENKRFELVTNTVTKVIQNIVVREPYVGAL